MKYSLLNPAFTVLLSCLLALPAFAADHREAPLIRQDPAADLGDLYAFYDPNDNSRLVLVLTVNGLSVPSENTTYHFSPDVRYRFMIDSSGDAVADSSIDTSFSSTVPGPQTFEVSLPNGDVVIGQVTPPSIEPEPNEPIVVDNINGVSVFAGQRDDPFFFDIVGFNRFLAGTGGFSGADGFSGENVSALVIAVPVNMIADGSDQIQVWATTERRELTLRTTDGDIEQNFGRWKQIERTGHPAINSAFIPAALKDQFNVGEPANDAADFAPTIVDTLMSLGTDDNNIGLIAGATVPDTLKIDLDHPTVYPNGRRLEDDVIDIILFFVFNQTAVEDGADANESPFSAEFPFLAPPHQPE